MIYLASALIGAVVGLISVAIFAVILQGLGTKNPQEAIKALRRLIYIALGSGLTDFVIFDAIFKSNGALVYYMIGFSVIFLVLGILILLDWLD